MSPNQPCWDTPRTPHAPKDLVRFGSRAWVRVQDESEIRDCLLNGLSEPVRTCRMGTGRLRSITERWMSPPEPA